MPLKLGNYGEWEGDRPGGHHPPACTCYDCNEERNKRNAAETATAYHERLRAVERRRALTQTRRAANPRASRPRTPSRGDGKSINPPVGYIAILLLIIGGILFVGITYGTNSQDSELDYPNPSATVVASEPTLEPTPVHMQELTPAPKRVSRQIAANAPTQTPIPPTAAIPTTAPTPILISPTLPAIVPIPSISTPTLTPMPTMVPTPIPPTPTPIPTLVPAPTLTPTSAPTPTANAGPLDPTIIEQKVIDFTNEERAREGLRPLTRDPAISSIARAHSRNMMRQGIHSHWLDGKDPTDRAADAGYDCRAVLEGGRISDGLSENIAKHPRPQNRSQARKMYGRIDGDFMSSEAAARRLVRRWMNSPGHRRNIMNPDHYRIGVGVAIGPSGWSPETVFATQNFSTCK